MVASEAGGGAGRGGLQEMFGAVELSSGDGERVSQGEEQDIGV